MLFKHFQRGIDPYIVIVMPCLANFRQFSPTKSLKNSSFSQPKFFDDLLICWIYLEPRSKTSKLPSYFIPHSTIKHGRLLLLGRISWEKFRRGRISSGNNFRRGKFFLKISSISPDEIFPDKVHSA